MTSADLPRLLAIADVVHPTYPEDAAVFEERLALFPAGCWVLEHHPHLASPAAAQSAANCVSQMRRGAPRGGGYEGEAASPSLKPLPLEGGGWGGGESPRTGCLIGYILSHPWRYAEPPVLNSFLGAIPTPPTTYYIHDIALLPKARGTGAANAIVIQLTELAENLGLPNLSLVAVNNSVAFWQRHGFALTPIPALDAKLRSYDDAARFMVRAIG